MRSICRREASSRLVESLERECWGVVEHRNVFVQQKPQKVGVTVPELEEAGFANDLPFVFSCLTVYVLTIFLF